MISRVSAYFVHGLRSALLAGVVLCIFVPALARAQQAGGQTPAAVQVNFSVQGQLPDSNLEASGNGVVNATGDMHLTFNVTQPSTHSIDIIASQGTVYLSSDGQPYQSFSMSDLSSSAPAGCAVPANGAAGGLPSFLNPQSSPLVGALIHPVGTATVNGVLTNHSQGHVDLGTFVPLLLPTVEQMLSSCGVPSTGFDPSAVQAESSGSTLDLDTYVGQTDNFPRRVQVNVTVPSGPFQLSAQVDLTPLATAVPVAPPQ